ncbi:hypothetical protein Clacol_004519 [Clathrus columnatus]|uniref:Uncharacterized protein n=1 Tax=Clathrus columnatus TaxID=1419009 RepID=A0AAV5A9Z6_9AGAM|nr:hypothetical protein Clacol_004519 [Clathrus columnatus]
MSGLLPERPTPVTQPIFEQTQVAQTIWRYDILSYSNPGLILDGEWGLYAGTAVGLVARPTSLWAMAIEFVTVGLYINSLLASLNSRSQLREMDSGTLEYQSRSLKTPISPAATAHNRITVTTTQTRYVDGMRSPVDLNMKFQSSDEGLDTAYSSEGKIEALNKLFSTFAIDRSNSTAY